MNRKARERVQFPCRLRLFSLLTVFLFAPTGCVDEETGGTDDASDSGVECDRWFGAVGDLTGLDESMCRPECSCGGETWRPTALSAEEILTLAGTILLDPPGSLESNPYEDSPPPTRNPSEVCGVTFENEALGTYRLKTFDGVEAARQAGAVVTHHSGCGRCSSLQDLSVYLATPALAEPVRQCGIEGVSAGMEVNVSCLRDIGFSLPCAEIWYYNTVNTRKECLPECMAALVEKQPNHLPDGSLNPCLQCDENRSGQVFKALAGRTRRNSGVASAICRPCESVARVSHDYPILR